MFCGQAKLSRRRIVIIKECRQATYRTQSLIITLLLCHIMNYAPTLACQLLGTFVRLFLDFSIHFQKAEKLQSQAAGEIPAALTNNITQ